MNVVEIGSRYLECTLDGSFGGDDRHAVHIQSMIPRTRERQSPLANIRRKRQRDQEQRVPLHSIITQRTSVHRDQLPLPRLFQNLEVGLQNSLSRQRRCRDIDQLEEKTAEMINAAGMHAIYVLLLIQYQKLTRNSVLHRNCSKAQ